MPADLARFDVAIGGGGSVGLALACGLADALGEGARIALLDRARLDGPTSADPRASNLSAASKRLLEALGVWGAIAAEAQPVSRIDITDSRLGDAIRPVLLSYDNTLPGQEPASYIVENERLRQALLAAAAQRGAVALLGGASLEAFTADAHGVHIDR